MSILLYRFINFLSRIVFFVIYPRKIIGRENMPKEGGVVVSSNHLHLYDVFSVATCFRRRITFMGKKQLYEHKVFGYVLRKYGSFPVDREGANIAAMREGIKRLKDGEALAVFPEGTRSFGKKEMGEFKEGAVWLAAKSDAYILPIYMSSREKMFRRSYILVGKPYKLPESDRIDSGYLRENTAILRERVQELCIYDRENDVMRLP